MLRVNFSRTKLKASFSSLHLIYKLTLNYFSFFFFFRRIISTQRLIKRAAVCPATALPATLTQIKLVANYKKPREGGVGLTSEKKITRSIFRKFLGGSHKNR